MPSLLAMPSEPSSRVCTCGLPPRVVRIAWHTVLPWFFSCAFEPPPFHCAHKRNAALLASAGTAVAGGATAIGATRRREAVGMSAPE
jgi:hypothetical protein